MNPHPPNNCPRCKASFEYFEYGKFEVDCETAWQSAECMKCHHTWDELYIFSEIYEEDERVTSY